MSVLTERDIRGKTIIDVGAVDINGSLRPFCEQFGPAQYLGVDIELGKGVDQICKVEDLVSTFGSNRFDVVITTEMLEHVPDWYTAIHNLKEILKPGGKIIITTRSFGFGYHGNPYDFWRYEIPDMKVLFSDFDIQKLQSDYPEPGVFLSAIKPANYVENNSIQDYKLYSIILDRRESFSYASSKIPLWPKIAEYPLREKV
jgi:SAM-dependent methyltransferase